MNYIKSKEVKTILDEQFIAYNCQDFILTDPISIPKSYTKLQDIEISAFWTSILSWGNRTTIINKAKELFSYMDNSPHDFVLHHTEDDLKKIQNFKHRTFQYLDTLYFIEFFKYHYSNFDSLEDAFLDSNSTFVSIEESLINFHNYFFSLDFAPSRTRKHIASPDKKSTCKRLNMFLRWMVREDENQVDFGLWKRIPSASLMIPLDVHVERVARKLGLLTRKNVDWNAVCEVTEQLRNFDKKDPVKYDFALFGMGVKSKDIITSA